MASHALDLWDACAKETQERRDRRRCPFLELCATLPSPKQYPAPLEEFLKLMLPKRRRDGREKSYRHFLIDWKKVDLGDAGDLLARHKQAPADKHEFKRRALLFETWFKVDLRRNRRLANLISRKSSPKAIKAEEKAADEERRQAVAAAEDRWNSACAHFIRRMVL